MGTKWPRFLDAVRRLRHCDNEQGCQMVYFQTKNPTLGKFWRALEGKMLKYLSGRFEYFTDIWYIL
jgi:hypothetical protein